MGNLSDLLPKLKPVESGYDLMRIGHPHDGGYLIPDNIEGIRYLYSPGVSGETMLEDQMAEKGMDCFLLDGIVDCPTFNHPEKIHFEKKFLKASSGSNSLSFDDWKNRTIGDYAGDLLLQMDIEGFEYEVFQSMSEKLLRQFRIIVVEFHELQNIERDFYFATFELLCAHFKVVHLHPNNFNFRSANVVIAGFEVPRVMEMTFFRNDAFVGEQKAITRFPHPLDANNAPNHPPLHLPACWF